MLKNRIYIYKIEGICIYDIFFVKIKLRTFFDKRRLISTRSKSESKIFFKQFIFTFSSNKLELYFFWLTKHFLNATIFFGNMKVIAYFSIWLYFEFFLLAECKYLVQRWIERKKIIKNYINKKKYKDLKDNIWFIKN